MLDLDALRSFIAFVDTGSFTQAARQVCRTQSAISMQMKKLEASTGQQLFVKQGRNLELTEQGQLLASYARQMLSLHDNALHRLEAHSEYPPLTLGCPDDYAEEIMPLVVQIIQQRYPTLSLRVHCDCSASLREMLDENIIQLAILSAAPDKEEGSILRHEVGRWVHGGYPELLEQEELPLILYEAGCRFRSAALDGLEKQNRRYRVHCNSSSATAIKSLIRQGLGVSALAGSSISADLTTISDSKLPALPTIDVILKPAASTHPLFDTTTVAQICSDFQQLFQTDIKKRA